MSKLVLQQKDMLHSAGLPNAIRNRRVLITGASGFVGLHLCEALLELGAEIHALSRNAGLQSLPDGITLHTVDLRNLDSVKHCLENAKPDVVYHLASLVNTRQNLNLVLPTLNNNLVGSVNLFLALAERSFERLVVVGSSEEPAAGRLGAIANSPYAAAKEAETAYARMFHNIFSLPMVLVRPFLSYGPRQPKEKIIPYVITSLLKGVTPEVSSGRRVCDLIFMQDLVMELILSGFKPGLVGKAIDLGIGVGITLRDVINLISQQIEASVKPKFGAIPDRLFEVPQIANAEETYRLIGYRPLWTLNEGIKLTIDWYRNNPGFFMKRRR